MSELRINALGGRKYELKLGGNNVPEQLVADQIYNDNKSLSDCWSFVLIGADFLMCLIKKNTAFNELGFITKW